MCGICGIVGPPAADPRVRGTVQAMNGSMGHRGPDGDGFHFDPRAALGHRRLSIIDLAGGDQPIFNEDHTIAIVFNGEIYNYLELQEELRGRGHQLRTRSDTEVINHLYEEQGAECVQALNGMFAFALWDAPRRRLLLARDRLGEKPLYYTQHGDALAFASELKALLHLPWIQRRINGESLDDYLAYGYVPGDRCILENIAKLPPGSRLIWQDGRAHLERYWQPQLAAQPLNVDVPELLDEFEHRLRSAVRLRLRSDVPLGLFLSGGVDSTAVVAMAQQESPRPVNTFTIGFEMEGFSEAPHARELARALGTEHHEMTVGPQNFDDLADLVWHLDEPLADPSTLPTFHVCRMARQVVKVCLSGDGGDELLAGYRRYPQAVRHARLDGSGLRLLRGPLRYLNRRVPRHWSGAGFIERSATHGAERYFAQCCFFSVRERAALLRNGWQESLQSHPWLFQRNGGTTREPLVSRLQELDQRTYLPDDILVKVDRMSMMNSLEVRVPLLDHTLVEFINRLPLHWKYREGQTKYLLRKVLARHVPDEVLQRPKRGFGIPIKEWFRDSLDSRARELLTSPGAALHDYLEPKAVARVLEDHRRGGRDLSRQVWSLLVLELWLQQFVHSPQRVSREVPASTELTDGGQS